MYYYVVTAVRGSEESDFSEENIAYPNYYLPSGAYGERYDPDSRGDIQCDDEMSEHDGVGTEESVIATLGVASAIPEAASGTQRAALSGITASMIGNPGGPVTGTLPAVERWVFLHVDHLGSPRVLFDQAGDVVSTHHFMPFGDERPIASRASAANEYFTGHERDRGMATAANPDGLDYMLARYYSSSLGRFMAVDPGDDTALEDPQSWNKYAYVRNNPINSTDPTGQAAETGFDIVMAGISIAQAIDDPSFANIAGAVLDVAAAATPFVPAVGGRLIDAAQAGGKVVDAVNAADNVADAGKAAGAAADYSKIPDPATGAKAGGDFTPRQTAAAKDANRQANGGVMRSDKSGVELTPSKQSKKGQKHDPNEANVDHKTSKKKGGTNASSNIQVLSRKENLKKGAN